MVKRSRLYRQRRFRIIIIILLAIAFLILLNFVGEEEAESEISDFPPLTVVIEDIPPDRDYSLLTSEGPLEIYIERGLPDKADGSFKTYMDYRTITNKSSFQYELQQKASTDDLGFRKLDGKYLVAMGSYYSICGGTEFRVTLDTGKVFEIVLGDVKQDRHTDKMNQYVLHNGNIIEFIVDSRVMHKLSKKMGDVSHAGLNGKIIKIEEKMKNE